MKKPRSSSRKNAATRTDPTIGGLPPPYAAPLPPDETRRLEVLYQYKILDTSPEKSFDDLAMLAAYICDAPIALVSFIDTDRQWVKARVGTDAQQVSRDESFCAHAIMTPDQLMVVDDTLADPRFREHPQVCGIPHIRFYAGAPLVMSNGAAIGTLCVVDTKARRLTERQCQALETLSRSVVNEIELRFVTLHGEIQRRTTAETALSASNTALQKEIAERIRAEDELRASQTILATAESVAKIGSWHWNLLTQKVIWSDEMFHLFGVDQAHFDGDLAHIISTRIHPDDADAVNEANRKVLEQAQTTPLSYRIILPDGTQRTVWAQGRLIYNEQGTPIALAGYVQDITEQRQTEAELRRSNAELAQFAYVASHDLQEPLRTVSGMVQLLHKRYYNQLDERANEYIRHAVEASTRMQTLINDLLAFSRVERRGRPLEHISAETALHAALENLTAAIQETNVDITFDPLPVVFADPTQLTQVFQNLIGNAIKFRSEQRPNIHISAQHVSTVYQFMVQDNGIGIEPQYFDRIFQVFQRLHTRREYTGNGIGLPLCKRIIERHGGRIWLESHAGSGTTVFFTLPTRSLNHET